MSESILTWIGQPRPALIESVANGIGAHVNGLELSRIEFYGYAVLPGDIYDIHSLAAATNTEEDIKVSSDNAQYRYYRYSVDEWSHYEHKCFDEANALLAELSLEFRSMHLKSHGDYEIDDLEVAHAKALLECILKGFELAKFRGVFGGREPFLVVWVSDSDDEIVVESAKRLNSIVVAAEFLDEFGS